MENKQMDQIGWLRTKDEAMAAFGARTLIDDESDQIVGGAVTGYGDGWIEIDGKKYTQSEFNTTFNNFANNVGFNAAAEILHNITGFFCREMNEAGGSRTDMELMGIVLNHFWSFYSSRGT